MNPRPPHHPRRSQRLDDPATAPAAPWYAEVTRYQWLVLVIASAGWVFDAFEGQLFNITRDDMLREHLWPRRAAGSAGVLGRCSSWRSSCSAARSAAIVFGTLADRFGRKPVMAVTILFYSLFSGLDLLRDDVWHVAILRFLVALGVGGEWAVAASLVAEVFPAGAARTPAGSSTAPASLGTWLAAAGGADRRRELALRLPARHRAGPAGALGPHQHPRARALDAGRRRPSRQRLGSFRDLFGDRRWRRRAIFGLLLAAVGLGTFWGVVVAGQDLARDLLLPHRRQRRTRRAAGEDRLRVRAGGRDGLRLPLRSARWPSGSAAAARSC